jgi:predicted RNA-binding protein YlqC (UPF0109 family)
MKDLVGFLVKGLVADPDAVRIREVTGDQTRAYEVRVDPRDRGVLIGKQGRTIRSVRCLVAAAALQAGERAAVEILD